jgi:hypothetical protein
VRQRPEFSDYVHHSGDCTTRSLPHTVCMLKPERGKKPRGLMRPPFESEVNAVQRVHYIVILKDPV